MENKQEADRRDLIDEKEKPYIGALRIYEDEELRDAAALAMKRGLDPGQLLKQAVKEAIEQGLTGKET